MNENKAHKMGGGGVTHDPSTPGVTITPPYPKYQNNTIDNNQMKMSKLNLTES